MDRICRLVGHLFMNDAGQDLIEYALLSSFVALVGIFGAASLGTALNNWYTSVSVAVNTHSGSAS